MRAGVGNREASGMAAPVCRHACDAREVPATAEPPAMMRYIFLRRTTFAEAASAPPAFSLYRVMMRRT